MAQIRAVELHIEEIVFHGVAPSDRAAVGSAVQAELGRLLSAGVPPALVRTGSVPALDGGRLAALPGERPQALGVRMARAIYLGLGGDREATL